MPPGRLGLGPTIRGSDGGWWCEGERAAVGDVRGGVWPRSTRRLTPLVPAGRPWGRTAAPGAAGTPPAGLERLPGRLTRGWGVLCVRVCEGKTPRAGRCCRRPVPELGLRALGGRSLVAFGSFLLRSLPAAHRPLSPLTASRSAGAGPGQARSAAGPVEVTLLWLVLGSCMPSMDSFYGGIFSQQVTFFGCSMCHALSVP